ncbi:MAG: DNA topoisomerase, partial [Thermomicrobiaceae bacterium]|nr:DNA topoisomerase [Thermomicrobiaceae bacterium]
TGGDGQGVNAVALREGATVVAALALPKGADGDVVVVTAAGMGKRTALSQFPVKHRATGGVSAIDLAKGDALAGAVLVGGDDDVVIGSASGLAVQHATARLRRQGRATKGGRLIDLPDGDRVTTVARVGA